MSRNFLHLPEKEFSIETYGKTQIPKACVFSQQVTFHHPVYKTDKSYSGGCKIHFSKF